MSEGIKEIPRITTRRSVVLGNISGSIGLNDLGLILDKRPIPGHYDQRNRKHRGKCEFFRFSKELPLQNSPKKDKACAILEALKSGRKKPVKSKKSKAPPKSAKKLEQELKQKMLRWKQDRYLKTLVLALGNKETIRKLPWQEHLIMEEIRHAMGKQDWVALQRLFPYCGNNTTIYQPVRFTYAFLLCLCSHASNEIYFENFLQTCISHNCIESGMLEKLMTLQPREHYKLTS